MTERDDHLPSFDPRSWVADRRGAPAAIGVSSEAPATDASFDPRTWRTPSATPAPDMPASDMIAPVPSRARTRATAVALGAGILACGAGWSWTVGRSMPPPPIAVAVASTTVRPVPAAPERQPVREDPPADGASRRTLNLADAAQLLPALRSLGLADSDAVARRAAAPLGSAPGEIRLQLDLAGSPVRLVRLEATRRDGAGVRLAPDARGGWTTEKLGARLAVAVRSVTGEMDATTFYAAAVGAGVPDSLITDFANAFAFDLDFQREVAPGDVFEAAWEQPANPAGEAVGPPRLVYASITTAAKRLRLYRITPPGAGEAAWFDAVGRSIVRSLMRTPVEAARVTSSFGYRTHPILGYRKLHRGTDFGAPTGTAVYAAANGVIDFAMPRGAAGNMVRLRHDNGWFTHYFHLSAFAPGLAPGTRVTQGQRIGDVGTTGRSTGPHLHYELWVDGNPVDPLSIDTGTGTATLEGPALAAFRTERARIDAARAGRAG